MITATYNSQITYLKNKVAPSKVGDCARQASTTPHETQEERPLVVAEFFHDLPEPGHQRCARLDALIRGHRLEQIQRNVRTAAHLY